MTDYVEIVLRRNRGWPWPEDSWGLTPMSGEDGWCRDCGIPKHAQTGSIMLQRKGLRIEGGWVPNWQFDVYCLAQDLAEEAQRRFRGGTSLGCLDRSGTIGASQIVIESSTGPCFRSADLERLIGQIHEVSSTTCTACGTTRWMPVGMDALPLPSESILDGNLLVVASPEWFGAGMQSFRQILWRRDVAEFLVAISPKDFKIQEIHG
ncbi:hypothetical protein [Nocardioides sp. YIM 152315]|uniref:hypothetical protein n=1 Tax=Nocardioides sp. YIM 152315 TaxID=3031760 RepID=UPI0023DB30E6|nr:hypothetical protein [Nocardioides sp. YIM 152315]MDF1605809.1 hypothetical protein [Nocardioides sp. YIM 152315]